jgi:hypothetical protein
VVETGTGNKTFQGNQLKCTVFPNPFTETIRIDCAFPVKSIEIYNTEVQLVYHQNNPLPLVNLSSIPSGFYVLRIISETQVFQQKIVKN